ncbi:MFS transporter [Actinoplanes sp. NBRC 101535]|uniref:MFS transporter n=1 Tax=Actinoplanes sp. NBRC 101535 TaxID=3032196 RepID=UPI0024A0FB8F|nr:MFS transporter [Actinoplanes sp. NBRC 101535]GLY01859.1 membrane protein [Actinoplanes sp. NBRC 101535]
MRTYRQLFRTPEFTPLFAAACTGTAATTVSGLALATSVYSRTGSPLYAALSMFGPSVAQMAGAMLLLSAADRLPPRAALTGVSLASATLIAILAVPGLPVPALFMVLLAMGLVSSVGGGARAGLLTEIVPEGAYLLGRSALNISVGTMQIVGFATGGLLVSALTPTQTLLAAACLHLTAALVLRRGLTRRAPRATGRPSVTTTWRVNRQLWSIPSVRPVYIGLWLPNGLIVGCEALFVPYAPSGAGLLLAASALGMLTGDVLAGRFLTPAIRVRLAPFMRLLLAVPYLPFALGLPLPLAAMAAAVAGVGYCSTLLLQERLVALTLPEFRGQALGLHTSGMLTMQAICAALAGSIAEWLSPATTITVMAAASVAVTLTLAPALRHTRPAPAPAPDPTSAPAPAPAPATQTFPTTDADHPAQTPPATTGHSHSNQEVAHAKEA